MQNLVDGQTFEQLGSGQEAWPAVSNAMTKLLHTQDKTSRPRQH